MLAAGDATAAPLALATTKVAPRSNTKATTPSLPTSSSFDSSFASSSSSSADSTLAGTQVIQTPRSKDQLFHMLDTLPYKWDSKYKLHLLKIKKATAKLHTEKTLLSKAHADTFAANNNKKGRLLRQNQEALEHGTTYGTAFGRVYSQELADKREAELIAKAEEKARRKAAAEVKSREVARRKEEAAARADQRKKDQIRRNLLKALEDQKKEQEREQKRVAREEEQKRKKEEQERKKAQQAEAKRIRELNKPPPRRRTARSSQKTAPSTQQTVVKEEVGALEFEGLLNQWQIEPNELFKDETSLTYSSNQYQMDWAPET